MNPASTIISDVKIKGTLEFSESLFLDCQFQGDIVSEGKLTVGEHGNVEGQIKAESVIVMGRVKGDITVTDSCKIRATGSLMGDMKAPKLEISEGAVIQGNVTVPFPEQEEPVPETPEVPEEDEKKEKKKEKETSENPETEDKASKEGSEDESELEEKAKSDKE